MRCPCQVWDYHHPALCAPTYIERLRKLIIYNKHTANIGKNLSICYEQITGKSIKELTLEAREELRKMQAYYITAFPEYSIYGDGGCVYCGQSAFYKHTKIVPTIRVGSNFQGNLCHKCYQEIGSYARLCPYYFHLQSICINRKLEIILPVGVYMLRAGLPKDIRKLIFQTIRLWLDKFCSC